MRGMGRNMLVARTKLTLALNPTGMGRQVLVTGTDHIGF